MAATILSCKKLLDGEASLDDQDTTSVSFVVETEEEDADPLEVAYASFTGKPMKGAAHPVNANLKAAVSVKRLKGSGPEAKRHWILKATYRLPNSNGNTGPSGETANSANIRVRVSGCEQAVYTQLQRDDDETPILNSVGDLYPDPQEVVLYDEQISISFEKNGLDMNGIADMRGAINDSAITLSIPQGALTFNRTFATNTLLLKTCDYEVVVSSDNSTVNVFGVEVVLFYRKDGWLRDLPDKGYRYYDADNNLTKWKEQAFYLDGNGEKLGEGEALVKLDAVQLHYSKDLATFLGGI